jgi:cytochrome P450
MQLAEAGTCPASDLDPFSIAYFDDPFPAQAALRDAGPVVFLSHYGIHGVARYEQVHGVLNDPATYCSGRGAGLADFAKEQPWRPPSLVLEADPPAHTAPRRVLSRILSAPAVATLRASFAASAAALVDQILARGGEVDVIPDLAEAFPLSVFPAAVGLQEEGRSHLIPYAALAFNAFGPDNELRRDALRTASPHVEWVMRQVMRENLSPEGFGEKIYQAADRGEIAHEQAPLLVRSLLTAGLDTTVNSIGAVLHCMARFPDQWQALRVDPARLAKGAFAEAIRLESPVQTFFRTTTRDVDLAGTAIPEGSKVITFLGSANRDPRKWTEPERYDISRRTVGHVGFGSGIHMCVGQLLAAMEGEVLLEAMAARIATIEAVVAPIRRYNNTLRGLASLRLKLVAA